MLALACGEPECIDGFELRNDGHCYPYALTEEPLDTGTPPDDTGGVVNPIDAWIESWEDCEAGSGNGELDLERACAWGICAGETYDEAVAAAGQPVELDTSDPGWVYAYWGHSVACWYYDNDFDGLPDPDTGCTFVTVFPDSGASTVDGIGSGDSLGCFVDLFGDPGLIEVQDLDGWQITALEWNDPDLKVWDYYGKGDVEGSDGAADFIYLGY